MREVYVTCPECSTQVKVGEIDPANGLLLGDREELAKVQRRVGDECRYHDTWEH